MTERETLERIREDAESVVHDEEQYKLDCTREGEKYNGNSYASGYASYARVILKLM